MLCRQDVVGVDESLEIGGQERRDDGVGQARGDVLSHSCIKRARLFGSYVMEMISIAHLSR